MLSSLKLIPGFDGFYAIDVYGGVFSCRLRGGRKRNTWKRLYQCPDGHGYLMVTLRLNGKKTRPYYVHRLMLETFVGSRPEGSDTRHIDSNKRNNKLSNLCYGTRSQNQLDRRGTSTTQVGEGNNCARLNEEAVKHIRQNAKLSRGRKTYKELSRLYNVSEVTIQLVVYGKTWRHVDL